MVHRPSQLRYRPEIDGLRTVAILPVILFHLNPQWLPGGFIGVDVFFVISGFLITSLLMKELEEHRFTLTGFWLRRIRRLLPALTVMILAVLLAGRLVLWPSGWKFLGTQGASALLSAANFVFCSSTGGYWGPVRTNLPLLHTWSLSVEEQFYLFYPILLALLHRRARPWLRPALAAASGASLLLCLAGLSRFPTASFYLLPMRGWELGVGGLLALRGREAAASAAPPAPRRFLAVAGLLGIGLSTLLVSENLGFPGYQALLPVLSTVLVLAHGAAGDGWAGRLLSSRPFVYLGKASYSLYLWHWPVLVFARACEQVYAARIPAWQTVSAIALCGGLSYHLVEKIGRTRSAWKVVIPGLFAACLGLSAWLHQIRPRHDYSGFAPVEWRGRLYDVAPVRASDAAVWAERMDGITAPVRTDPRPDILAADGVRRDHGGGPPEVMVLGDSHALMWSGLIDDLCREAGVSAGFFAADGVNPLFGAQPRRVAQPYLSADGQYDLDTARIRALHDWKPRVIILVSRWDQYLADEEPLRRFAAFLSGGGAVVLMIEQPPVLHFGDRNALQAAVHLRPLWGGEGALPIAARSGWAGGNAMIRRVAAACPRGRVVPVADLYQAPGGRAKFADASRLLYIDDDHLSDFGAHLAGARIREALLGALRESRSPAGPAKGRGE